MPVISELDPLNPRGPRDGRSRPVVVSAQGNTVIKRPVGYARRRRMIPKEVLIHERRRQAYQLAIGQFSNEEIGLYLHADPSVNTRKISVDGGYGWQNFCNGKPPLMGDNLRNAVSRDMSRGLASSAKYEKRAQDDLLAIEVAGLNKAQASIWSQVLQGNLRAVEQFVLISARRSKILGLDIDRVEAHTTLTVEAVQGAEPVYDQEFISGMMSALKQVGAIKELSSGDIVDAEVVADADS